MRHDMAFQIFEKVAVVGELSKKDFRTRLDDLSLLGICFDGSHIVLCLLEHI